MSVPPTRWSVTTSAGSLLTASSSSSTPFRGTQFPTISTAACRPARRLASTGTAVGDTSLPGGMTRSMSRPTPAAHSCIASGSLAATTDRVWR